MMKPALSAVVAVATTTLTGLVLSPLVSLVFDRFFHLYLFTAPPPDHWKDELVILATISLWIIIASAAGGFVSSLLTEKKEDFAILLFCMYSLIIALVINGGNLFREFDFIILVPSLSYIAGACLGGFAGVRYKKRKIRPKE